MAAAGDVRGGKMTQGCSSAGSCQALAWPSMGICHGLDNSDSGGEQGKRMAMWRYRCHGCDDWNKVTHISVAHKPVNSEPNNIYLGPLESF